LKRGEVGVLVYIPRSGLDRRDNVSMEVPDHTGYAWKSGRASDGTDSKQLLYKYLYRYLCGGLLS
jgi:hypothetical protein